MPDTATVIVGAGHGGLAMSRCLSARSVDHVVLERGQVANSWRTQRLAWPSNTAISVRPLADALPDWEVLVSAFGEDGLVVEPDELVDPDRPER